MVVVVTTDASVIYPRRYREQEQRCGRLAPISLREATKNVRSKTRFRQKEKNVSNARNSIFHRQTLHCPSKHLLLCDN